MIRGNRFVSDATTTVSTSTPTCAFGHGNLYLVYNMFPIQTRGSKEEVCFILLSLTWANVPQLTHVRNKSTTTIDREFIGLMITWPLERAKGDGRLFIEPSWKLVFEHPLKKKMLTPCPTSLREMHATPQFLSELSVMTLSDDILVEIPNYGNSRWKGISGEEWVTPGFQV